jgi:hypothetical protein
VKFDLHIHSRFSSDSASCPKDIVRRALQLGLGLIAITDHDVNASAFDWLVSEGVLSAAGLLRPEWAGKSDPVSAALRVLPGQEISTATGHLLCLVARLDPSPGIPAADAVREIHRQGGLAIAAHPFDRWRAAYEPAELESLPFDAVEVFNGGATNAQVNGSARELARRRGLAGVANSDGHTLAEIGRCYSVAKDFPLGRPFRLAAGKIRAHAAAIEPRVTET